MRATLRTILAALSAASLLPATTTLAQQQAPAAQPRPPAMTKEQKAKLDEAVATVNGEKITRGQLLQFLGQYEIAPGSEQTAYTTGMDILINNRLLTQFLNGNRVPVKEDEITKKIDEQRRVAAENNTSLESVLADSGTTLDQFRDSIKHQLQWFEFVDKTATDATLKAYMEANKDAFNNTQVKASHIQRSYDPETASAADKEKAKTDLLAIKKEIQGGKITFADAANRYSDDPVNKEQPSGGDLRWFQRKGRLSEAFAAAAFALPKGSISDPVESEWGLHLIQVADRREGKMPPLEQVKEKVKNQYIMDEQNRIIAEQRKTAKIDIRPMPADLFGPRPAASSGASAKPKT